MKAVGANQPMPAVSSDELAGLLADERRLRVFAAVVLGAAREDEIVAAAGLEGKAVRTALDRLIRGQLIESSAEGYRASATRFTDAARWAAGQRHQVTPEELGATPEQAAVLRNFLIDGRLTHLPVPRQKRRVVLDFLAGRFEPGVQYPERDVNFMLGQFHRDYAALRRALVDEEFLERRDGFYWRAGGTVAVD